MSMSMSMATSTMSGMTMSKRAPATSGMDMSSMAMSMPTSTNTDNASKTSSAMSMATSTAALVDNIHVSGISTCANKGVVAVGDEWTIVADYDPTKHDLMLDTNGTAAPIMGIALVYVAEMNVTITNTQASGTASGAASSASSTGTSAGERAFGVNMLPGLGMGLLVALFM